VLKIGATAAAALVLAAAVPSAGPPVPDAIAQAVRALAAERRGVTAFHRHYAYEERGPGHDKTLVVDSIRVRENGRLAAVRLLDRIENGKPDSPEALAKAQADADKQLPGEDFRLPLAAEALSDYRFEVLPVCEGCAAGSVAIAFTSVVRDASHGDGTVTIDAAHHIAALAFHPSALPAHADSGSITIRFDRVLPDLWDVTVTHEHYTGHVLFLHGWGDVVQTDSAYRRYPSVEDALQPAQDP
jgi:hypothetical protein